MAHCLLARDRAAGTVTVLSPASFDRSDDAAEAARALVVSGTVDPESTEILIVDLSDASRVEFITLAAPLDEPASEEFDLAPAAGVWETPAEVPEPAGRDEEPEPASEPEPEAEPEPELEPGIVPDVDEAPVAEEAVAALEPDSSPLLEPVLEPAPAPVPVLEPAPAPKPLVEPLVEPLSEPALESEPLPWLTQGPAPEPAPMPTIETAAEEPSAAETPVELEDEPAPAEPVVISEITIVESLPVVELDVGPYEVSGELILERYTCDDCVYANTCPKVGESAPAECGSFQWKAL